MDDSVADTNEQLKALDGLADYVGDEPVTTETEYVQPVENYCSVLYVSFTLGWRIDDFLRYLS